MFESDQSFVNVYNTQTTLHGLDSYNDRSEVWPQSPLAFRATSGSSQRFRAIKIIVIHLDGPR